MTLPAARPARTAAFAVLVVLAFGGLSGCGDGPEVCAPEAQVELLNGRVGEQPSDAFTIPDRATGYVMVTVEDPSDNGIFSNIGGVATLHVIQADAAPRISVDAEQHHIFDDPEVNVRRLRRWERLDVRPGVYRLYSWRSSPTIAVIACPA